MATDRVSFYDESLKKQVEGSFVSDGKKIHVIRTAIISVTASFLLFGAWVTTRRLI
jgi:hypothetical protein